MKLFDTIYYGIYRFGRSLRQPHVQAEALAETVMPYFFLMLLFCAYCIVKLRWGDGKILPKNAFVALLIAILILSYFVYGGRGKKILAEYGKLKNQRFYWWLGMMISIVSVSFPILFLFVLIAVAKK